MSRGGLDCTTPKWRGLRSTTKRFPNHALPSPSKLSLCYHIHVEISVRVRSFPLTSQVFSPSWMCTPSSWGFRRVHRSHWELKKREELRKILSVVGKGNFPQASWGDRSDSQQAELEKAFQLNLHNFLQVVEVCTPTAETQKWCPKQAKQSHSILPKLI